MKTEKEPKMNSIDDKVERNEQKQEKKKKDENINDNNVLCKI